MDYFQEIDNYIWGRLSPEKAKAFERQMNEDDSLAEEVAMKRREVELISKMEEAYWLTEMKAWREEMKTEERQLSQERAKYTPSKAMEASLPDTAPDRPKLTVLKRIVPWAAAATVALLIGFFWILPSDSSFSVVQEAVKPARLESIQRSTSESEVQAMPPSVRLFIQAYDHLENQEYSLADETFLKIENNPQAESWLLEAVEYNRALIRLELGSSQEARTQLEKISNTPSHRYHRKAKRLLKKIPS